MSLNKFLQNENSLANQERNPLNDPRQINNLSRDFVPPTLKDSQIRGFKPNANFAQILIEPTLNASAVIQAGLNEASSKGGGRVILSPGTYAIANQLSIPTDVSLEGIDTESTLLNFAPGTANIVFGTESFGNGLKSLSFANCTNGSAVVYVPLGGRMDFTDLSFTDCSGGTVGTQHCFYLGGGNGLVMINISVSICDSFLMGTSTTESVFANNVSVSNTKYGVTGNELDFSSFINCDLHCNISAVRGTFDATFWANNHFAESVFTGTRLVHLSGDGDDNTFSGNVFQGVTSGVVPFVLDDSNLNKITGNTIVCAGTDAVQIINGADDNVFSGNRITSNGANTAGIRVGANSDRTVAISNNLEPLTAGTSIIDGGTNTRGTEVNLNAV